MPSTLASTSAQGTSTLGLLILRCVLCGFQFPSSILVGEVPGHLPDASRVQSGPTELVDGVEKVKKSQLKSRGRRWYEVT